MYSRTLAMEAPASRRAGNRHQLAVILDLFQLTGKNALVTGSRSGLGAAMVVALAEAGANVVVHGRRSEGIDAVCAAVRAAGAGLVQLTKALANEWATRGIDVNAIAPGYMETCNTATLRADATRNRQILERIPAGRWGTPADLSGAVVFLASAASNYLHGHLLVVDGGRMAR